VVEFGVCQVSTDAVGFTLSIQQIGITILITLII